MLSEYEIRADFDKETIVVYQAYPKPIAEAALRHGTFAAPFSFQRMTWIKPSFLWLMERSNWGQKSGQGAYPGRSHHAQRLGRSSRECRSDFS